MTPYIIGYTLGVCCVAIVLACIRDAERQYAKDPDLPRDDDEAVNVLVLEKGNERYVFLWVDEYASEVKQTVGRFASDPDLSFDWFDATKVASRVVRMEER